MQTVLAPRGDARTFLTHFVVGGLDDDRYVVEKKPFVRERQPRGTADDHAAQGSREDAACP